MFTCLNNTKIFTLKPSWGYTQDVSYQLERHSSKIAVTRISVGVLTFFHNQASEAIHHTDFTLPKNSYKYEIMNKINFALMK